MSSGGLACARAGHGGPALLLGRDRFAFAFAFAFACALGSAGCEPPPPDEPPEPPPVLDTPYEVNPTTCDAGQVPVNGLGQCVITVTNVTDVDVNVTGATDGPPFLAVGANGALAAGESLDVTVSAVPRAVGVDEGELSLGPGRLIVPLVVEGIEETPPLVLAFDVTPDDVVEGDVVSVDSGVPLGGDFVFAWTLVQRPVGSSASLTSTNESVTSFSADLAGTYTLELVVENGDGSGVVAQDQVVVTARPSRNLALTISGDGAVLHFRPSFEALCGPLDCFAGDCVVVLGNGPRQSPTAAGGGIVVEDLPVGTFRVAATRAEGGTAGSATVNAFVQGNLAAEVSVTALAPGDAHEVLDIVVSDDGAVNIVEVNEPVVDGDCA